MNADGTGVTRIAEGNVVLLDWSSANRIAFYSEAGAGIYTMNPDGTDVRFLFGSGAGAQLVSRRDEDRLRRGPTGSGS